MVLSGEREFSNSNITSEKSLMMRLLLLLLMLELVVMLRVGMGMEAVESSGLLCIESILSLEFEELLATGVGGETRPDEAGDKSKSVEEVSNLRKLFEELQS